VERYLAVLEERPEIDLVYGPCLYWYSWSGEPEGRRRDHVGDIGIAPGTVVGSPRLRKRFLAGKGGFRPRVSNILARRTVIDRVSSLEEPPRGIDEDQAFLAKISSNAVIYLIDECLDRHRPHQTSRAEAATSADAHVPAGTDFHGGISSNRSRPRPRSDFPAPGAAVETSQSVGGDLDRQTRLSPGALVRISPSAIPGAQLEPLAGCAPASDPQQPASACEPRRRDAAGDPGLIT
jgi:hypothetical protein